MRDRVALVTGSARGIGKAIALRLGKEGYKVIVSDLAAGERCEKVVQEIRNDGGIATAVSCDVTDPTQIKEMIDQIITTYGRLDILVNNAGIAKNNLLARISEDEWKKTIDTNLNGTFLCTKAVIRQMMKQRYGRIVNISSVVGLYGNPGQAHYAASKAGIIGLTKTLAKEVGSRGITANAIAPGYIQTSMTEDLKEEYWDEILRQVPLRRAGTPEDVAGVVAFLVSSDADYITGQVIVVDGGMK